MQQALEIAIGRMIPPLIREFGTRDFCFAGGVALNCTANARMIRDLGIRSHIHPAAGDAGGALGAALQSIMRGRENGRLRRYQVSAYLGVSYPERGDQGDPGAQRRAVPRVQRHRRDGRRRARRRPRRRDRARPRRMGPAGARRALDPGRPAAAPR